jgi:GTP-binding protein LepA
MKQNKIRNFCIIAHIDHGKSTLADRIMETCGAIGEREKADLVLDSMDLERERGITIKASAVRLKYRSPKSKTEYILNLIDTPGHVDFSYEVSRSLAACEGALLVVDATRGVEAQTVANAHLAEQAGLTIIPVVNKVDMQAADADRTKSEIEDMLALPADDALPVSARSGQGVAELLESLVELIPPPKGEVAAPLQALIFDSSYDPHRGIIAYVRVRNGVLAGGMKIRMMQGGGIFEVTEVGTFTPKLLPAESLGVGEVGYVIAGIKGIGDAKVGDTITEAGRPAAAPLPGYQDPKPMVFCGLFPSNSDEYPNLRAALDRLQLNDGALGFEPENSAALGFGFRCGFLGLLHMEIVQERLEREFDLDLVATAPSVGYHVLTTQGETLNVATPSKMPTPEKIAEIEEPYILATLTAPAEYVGACLDLAETRRGIFKTMEYSQSRRVIIIYEIPLGEILLDFYDGLKSRTRGYATLDYEFIGYRKAEVVKLDLLVNGEPADALSAILPRAVAEKRARQLVEKLKEAIPRQQYEVRVQASIGNRIVAAEKVRPLRKDVIAKCYGGDITRKRKLLEKQKAGKKRMKQIGRVEIPQEAFLSVLKIASNE